MRQVVIPILLIVVVAAVGLALWHAVSHPGGYVVSGIQDTRFHYLVKIYDPQGDLKRGEIVLVRQSYLLGDDFYVHATPSPYPVAVWRDGWYAVERPAGLEGPFRLEPNSFRILNGEEILAAEIPRREIPHQNAPDYRSSPISNKPSVANRIQGESDYAFISIQASASYVYVAVELKPDREGKRWELDHVYWLNSDGTMQAKDSFKRLIAD